MGLVAPTSNAGFLEEVAWKVNLQMPNSLSFCLGSKMYLC